LSSFASMGYLGVIIYIIIPLPNLAPSRLSTVLRLNTDELKHTIQYKMALAPYKRTDRISGI